MTRPDIPRTLMAMGAITLLAGCGPSTTRFPVGNDNAKQSRNPYVTAAEARGSIFAEDGIAVAFSPARLFDGDEATGEGIAGPAPAAAPPDAIRVNGYLWSAALEAVSFMPLEHADPAGGIIQSGWFVDPDFTGERFRVNVFVLSGDLRDDAVSAGVFYERRDGAEGWVPVRGEDGAAEKIQALIVERARVLRADDRTRAEVPAVPGTSAVARHDRAVTGALPPPSERPPYVGEPASDRF